MNVKAMGLGGATAAGALWLLTTAVQFPMGDWYQDMKGTWTPSPKCEAFRKELLEKAGALAFAVSRNGIECGWDSEKPTVSAVTLGALQHCAARRVGDCKVIYEREATYDLSKDCKEKLEALYSQPSASAFAADKTGVCGFVADRDNVNEATAIAMENCNSRKGYECKVIFSRERSHEPSVVCRALLAKLRAAKTPFALALNQAGDCSAFAVEHKAKRQTTEQEVLLDCNNRYGPDCRLYASE